MKDCSCDELKTLTAHLEQCVASIRLLQEIAKSHDEELSTLRSVLSGQSDV